MEVGKMNNNNNNNNTEKKDYVLFSSYIYFKLDNEPYNKKPEEEKRLIRESLINGFKNDCDNAYVEMNIGKTFIITIEESMIGQRSLDFNQFKKLATHLKILQNEENSIVVEVIRESIIELIIALLTSEKFYRDNLFIFKMYPLSV